MERTTKNTGKIPIEIVYNCIRPYLKKWDRLDVLCRAYYLEASKHPVPSFPVSTRIKKFNQDVAQVRDLYKIGPYTKIYTPEPEKNITVTSSHILKLGIRILYTSMSIICDAKTPIPVLVLEYPNVIKPGKGVRPTVELFSTVPCTCHSFERNRSVYSESTGPSRYRIYGTSTCSCIYRVNSIMYDFNVKKVVLYDYNICDTESARNLLSKCEKYGIELEIRFTSFTHICMLLQCSILLKTLRLLDAIQWNDQGLQHIYNAYNKNVLPEKFYEDYEYRLNYYKKHCTAVIKNAVNAYCLINQQYTVAWTHACLFYNALRILTGYMKRPNPLINYASLVTMNSIYGMRHELPLQDIADEWRYIIEITDIEMFNYCTLQFCCLLVNGTRPTTVSEKLVRFIQYYSNPSYRKTLEFPYNGACFLPIMDITTKISHQYTISMLKSLYEYYKIGLSTNITPKTRFQIISTMMEIILRLDLAHAGGEKNKISVDFNKILMGSQMNTVNLFTGDKDLKDPNENNT